MSTVRCEYLFLVYSKESSEKCSRHHREVRLGPEDAWCGDTSPGLAQVYAAKERGTGERKEHRGWRRVCAPSSKLPADSRLRAAFSPISSRFNPHFHRQNASSDSKPEHAPHAARMPARSDDSWGTQSDLAARFSRIMRVPPEYMQPA